MEEIDKIRIFAEYIGCLAVKEDETKTISIDNIPSLIEKGFKIKLKSVYDISQEDAFVVAEEMRYRRLLGVEHGGFRDFHEGFRVSSESRNHSNFDDAMIHYTYRRDDEMLQGNWFRISRSLSVDYLKSKGYDVGSYWAFEMDGKDHKKFLSIEAVGLAIVVEE